jgi:hypothetical protein
MWQAPVIMIAAQAFLLQIVADEGIDWWARLIVLVAVVVAALAAGFTLLRGHAREVQFSEEIATDLDRSGIPGVRPPELEALAAPSAGDRVSQKLDHGVRKVLVSDRWPHAALWWAAALLAFGIADILVFFATT